MIGSIEEMRDFEDRWERLRLESGGTVFSSDFLVRTWFEAFSKTASPRVVVVENDHGLIGVAPLAYYRYRVAGFPFKMLTLAGDVKGLLRLYTNSVLYRSEDPEALESLVMAIKRQDWNVLWTANMDRCKLVDQYMEKASSTWNCLDFDPVSKVTIPIPDSGEISCLFDKKGKRTLKKALNKIEREGHRMTFRNVPYEDIDRAAETYAQQHIGRWATKGGSHFSNTNNVDFLKMASKAAYTRKKGFVYELEIDGQVAAQMFGFLEGRTAYGYRIGMSNDFMPYSPGWLICNSLFAELREKGIECCVMGRGSERYKYEMGGVESPLVGIGATRGIASWVSRIASSRPVKAIGSRLNQSGPASVHIAPGETPVGADDMSEGTRNQAPLSPGGVED
ncbi:MAG: GNAT family N-acetyltransferase [Methanomassiliicoccus sp.]|nr:GNAT family N-acetyltransferase [Methanomassiliicoccus sp.]